MSLDTLNNGDTGLQARTKINAAITATDAKVPGSRLVSTSGLATGGGNLSADRTISVPVASQAQAEAGSDNATAMTPLRTAQAIAALGGGGGGLSSVTGSLQCNTTPGDPATAPPDLHITSSGVFSSPSGRVYLTANGTTYVLYLGSGDVGDGSVWIDNAGISDDSSLLNAMYSAFGTLGASANYNWDGTTLTVTVAYTGSSSSLSCYNDFGFLSFDGGGTGTDTTPDTGGNLECTIVTATTGKKIGTIRAFVDGAVSTHNPVGLFLRSASAVDTQIGESTTSDERAEILPLAASMTYWLNGKDTGEALVAKLLGTSSLDGSSCNLGVIYQTF